METFGEGAQQSGGKMPYIVQVVGYSNSGKTTLVTKLIRLFTEQGLTVGSVKHDAHDFEMDKPGKDTWKHREAGAKVVAITSADKAAVLFQERKTLDELLTLYQGLDLVIIEGYKLAHYPKIVVVRNKEHEELLDNVTGILAVAAWRAIPNCDYRQFHVDDAEAIASEILNRVRIS
ncbi:molybdopterin-guanine dinucleotide biosynthesis protein B [Aneurinibacillus sp. Ricciae_BoGa-3]|uniref:molybdopterin-guanine dinucleotide biosynthesis protein B n=1 Tax=Aneurinibacillus sp. Ricciae_BoGa-3 TaxID=3022697 RepID=UPI002340B8B0|nr:molybdopterin-guanine dinucleotide biosynthesis protein B [Aneurinibacillus sp. Ricciae_BoGa-3]WCK52432.1 molybdopterin-guanine dinucleotide biosynthesis protein B [Aneurinibacillus sp. Ricciae_BoGa-3]